MSLNTISVIGNLVGNPIPSHDKQGKQICYFSIAVDDDVKKEPDFFNVQVLNEVYAKACLQHLKKGRQVCVSGSAHLHSYGDGDSKKYCIAIRCINPMSVYFLNGFTSDSSESDKREPPEPKKKPSTRKPKRPPQKRKTTANKPKQVTEEPQIESYDFSDDDFITIPYDEYLD